jgi:dihydroorotate dehydrogenase
VDLYRVVLRPLLFSGLHTDPEWLHQQLMQGLHWIEQKGDRLPMSYLQHSMAEVFSLADPRLEQRFWGQVFKNPLGLAPGFDKDGIITHLWEILGFGFVELGTVTLQAQPGNPRPRLFRLPQDWAGLNRMGFNNQGADALADRLRQARQRWTTLLPLGINLGKSKATPLEQATQDYVESFRRLQPYGDYFVINVSSPNTPGLRSLQQAEQLELILSGLQHENHAHKPLFIKISPDLDWQAIDNVTNLAQAYQLTGIIATNTTTSRAGLKTQTLRSTGRPIQEEAGGISGAPLRKQSTAVIRHLWQQSEGKMLIIGVGGIFTAEDAWEKITAGASLVQVYTGWIYEGPGMVRRILKGLLRKLEQHELTHIQEAIGLEHRL